MSKKATEFQRKAMSRMYRGKEIFKPLNTGWIDKNVACVREWVANIFFYCKDNAVIMIDAGYNCCHYDRCGYNYDRLAEKWAGWESPRSRFSTSHSYHPPGHRPCGRGGSGQPRIVPKRSAVHRGS